MKLEKIEKSKLNRISDMENGDTFIFGNNIFMKVDVYKIDFDCPECETTLELDNYGYFAVNIENGEMRAFDNDSFEVCTCNVKVEKGGVSNED